MQDGSLRGSKLETSGNQGQNRRRTEINGSLTTDESFNRQRRAGVVSRAGRISNGNYESSPAWYAFESGKRDRLLLNGFKTGVAIDVGGEKSQFNKEKWKPLVYLPIPISHMCCQKMKKQPIKAYQHKNDLYPFLGTLAEESRIRKQAWIRHGCNAFDSKSPTSQPLSFWTEQDILAYIVQNGLKIASVYGDIISVDKNGNEYPASSLLIDGCRLKCSGCERTGCVWCAFGMHNERGITRFQRLAQTHPRQYEYSIGGGQWVDNPHYDPTAPKMDGDWENWNPKKIWVPSKKGLGMGKVFDMVNEIYGNNFYRYK